MHVEIPLISVVFLITATFENAKEYRNKLATLRPIEQPVYRAARLYEVPVPALSLEPNTEEESVDQNHEDDKESEDSDNNEDGNSTQIDQSAATGNNPVQTFDQNDINGSDDAPNTDSIVDGNDSNASSNNLAAESNESQMVVSDDEISQNEASAYPNMDEKVPLEAMEVDALEVDALNEIFDGPIGEFISPNRFL